MSKRSPLYADGHHEPDLDKFSQEDRDESKRIIKRSVMKWLFGWVLIIIISVTLFNGVVSLRTSLYYSGYVLIILGGGLAYASAMGGNYTNTWGAYAGMADLVTADIFAARGRMFGKWLGPLIGIVLGFAMLIYYG